MSNIVTYKIKYECEDKQTILNYVKNYNNIVKFTYNRLLDVYPKNLSTKELTALQKEMNNIFLDSHFKNSAIYESKALINKNKDKSICFGGKNLWKQYNKGLICKQELTIKKLLPLCSIGESTQKANRKFNIVSDNEILFKPSKDSHIKLILTKYKNYKSDLLRLVELQNSKEIAITYKLDLDYIYLTFDLNKVREIKSYKAKENRIFAIDMNPNYIGYSVVDWKDEMKYKIINSGVISIKELNDYDSTLKGKGLSSKAAERKYITNKRNYEIVKIVQELVKTCKHYKCEIFAVEDLKMISKDKEKGKRFNRLCNNQWCRTKFTQILEKYCNLNSITLQKVMANYSSFLGNLVYREEKLPDMILSSIEIGRRGYEFTLQYNKKVKNKKKNIIFPDLQLVKDRVNHALEVLKYSESWNNLQKLFYSLKNLKLKYRVSIESLDYMVFRLKHKKSYINLYSFI